MSEAIIILCAFPNAEEAQKISSDLLNKKLVACAHLPAPGQSSYWWEGKIETASEIYALFKTRADLYKDVEAAILRQHSYKVPAIISSPINTGHDAFLKWIADETKI